MRSGPLMTCVVAGIKYLLHPQKLATIETTINPDALIPVTLLTTDEIFNGDVDALLQLYDVYDDVFAPEFGAVLVEKTTDNTTDRATAHVQQIVHRLSEDVSALDFEGLPSGPYFLYGPNLYQAWRLYDDDLEAFTFGIIPENVTTPNTYQPLTALSESGLYKSIPVPSRLYHSPPNSKKPLNGLRIAVTDSLDIEGVPTTLSSRAWMSLHGSDAPSSSSLVEELFELGAVIIGKTKTSQFTIGHDWIDTTRPWLARGDGYQKLSGSSAGAAAALSGYEWLARVVGDGGLSELQKSAAQTGFFALRPSVEFLDLDGSIQASKTFRNTIVATRVLDDLIQMAKATLKDQNTTVSSFSGLLRFTDLESALEEDEKDLYESFVQALENNLAQKSKLVNLTKLWVEDGPSTAKSENPITLVQEAMYTITCYEFYHKYKNFNEEYEERFDQRPYLEPQARTQWETGTKTSASDYHDAKKKLETFNDWFRQKVLLANSTTAIILPVKPESVVYRDSTPTKFNGNSGTVADVFYDFPQVLAPFAQIPYESTISGRTEYKPFSAMVIGSANSDLALLRLVQSAFHLAQWRTRVDTGRFTFPLADNPRNVDDRQMDEQRQRPDLETPRAVDGDAFDAVMEL